MSSAYDLPPEEEDAGVEITSLEEKEEKSIPLLIQPAYDLPLEESQPDVHLALRDSSAMPPTEPEVFVESKTEQRLSVIPESALENPEANAGYSGAEATLRTKSAYELPPTESHMIIQSEQLKAAVNIPIPLMEAARPFYSAVPQSSTILHDPAKIKTRHLDPVLSRISSGISAGFLSFWNALRKIFNPRINFFQVHLLSFLAVGLVFSIFIYLSELRNTRLPYIDAVYLSWSMLTCTGLVTVDISKFQTLTLCIFGFLMFIGSPVVVSLIPVVIRMRHFRKELGFQIEKQEVVAAKKSLRRPSWDLGLPQYEKRVIEYHAMKWLLRFALVYLILCLVVPTVLLSLYLGFESKQRSILIENGFSNSFGWSLFHVISAFSNTGVGMFALNIIPFNQDALILVTLGALILLGNTMYPIVFREFIRQSKRLVKKRSCIWYLLAHPRSVYTLLFPPLNTYILFYVNTAFALFQTFLSLGIDWSAPSLGPFPPQFKILISFFQSISTRHGGFNSIDLSLQSAAVIFLQAVAMYIGAVPLVTTVRGSAIVEEELKEDEELEFDYEKPMHLKVISWFKSRNFLVREVTVLFGLVISLLACETPKFRRSTDFTIFRVLYEVCSAYGTVGVSLGYPNTIPSFSGQFSTYGKLLMIAIMLAGKHRGLPTGLDSAVKIESLKNARDEFMSGESDIEDSRRHSDRDEDETERDRQSKEDRGKRVSMRISAPSLGAPHTQHALIRYDTDGQPRRLASGVSFRRRSKLSVFESEQKRGSFSGSHHQDDP